ncbi:amidohydrolase [Desulfospira joergensenii]|uniref:amidohydrolase n=1 Tax=Desulfospira joergensenii TaxID=53329 RepID=UPI000418CF83|nr:amidohydrolase [Desulfospira joergensenii]
MDTPPDLIFYNGTFQPPDNPGKEPTALAVTGRRITALGGDRELLALAGSSTRRLDLGGRLVLPGFCDSHFHFYEWAVNYDSINFADTRNFGGMEKAIQEKARDLGPGQWVLGQGFNESEWPENRMPNRVDLDRIAPDNPVCIWRCDCHLAVANSSALALAGINENYPDPEGGVIERDEAGKPNGVLKELAPNLIREAIPALPESRLMDNMEKAMAHAHSLGLTCVHDVRLMGGMDGADALKTWQSLHARGRLRMRCHVALPGEMTDQAIALGLCTGFGDDLLKIGHLKFFADGGMGARTGWMTEKYLDAEFGMPLTPIEEIKDGVTRADRAGLSCMVHAIGDRACQEVISIFEGVEQAGESRCRVPHRIEHVQMILPRDLDRLGRLKNLAVSCQPNNLSLDISMIDQCAGPRGKYAYALKSILNTGIPMMLSSDAPVADPNPFAGIYSAVTRKRMNKTPEGGWYPEQCLDIGDAVKAYTLTPALASGTGHDLGSISVGKLADLVITDRNIFDIEADEIAGTKPALTLFNGEVVYES